MALYFVRHTDDDGENFDLFVRATSVTGVFGYWRVYFGLGEHNWPTYINEVPDEPAEGAVSWNTMPEPWSAYQETPQ